nr:ribosome maturation protein sdo1 [Quercus suber]
MPTLEDTSSCFRNVGMITATILETTLRFTDLHQFLTALLRGTYSYTISWHRSTPNHELPLDGVEYKSLPSGLHELEQDLVYFVHEGEYLGLSAYRRGEAAARERGARFLAVGVLVEERGTDGTISGYAGDLADAAEKLLKAHDDVSVLEKFWEEHRSRSSKSAITRHNAEEIPPSLTAHHPARGMLQLIDTFGPLLFPLHRAALLRKRILLLGSPPVRVSCDIVYGLSILSEIPQELMQDVLQNTAEAGVRGRIGRLYSIGIHDIDKLAMEQAKQRSGWVACTTDDILAHKTNLWDVLVDMPSHRNSRWPNIRTSEGTILKASQRDLRRYHLLRSEIAQTIQLQTNSEEINEDLQGDRQPLIKRQSSSANVRCDSAGEEEITEPVAWTTMAYNGFIWWASAGEQAAWENEEETADRVLSSEFSEIMGPNDSSNAWRTAVMVKSYFNQVTSLILRTLGHAVVDADDQTEAGIEEDLIMVSEGEARMMGLNGWHEGDRTFITDIVRVWFGRIAQVQWSEIRSIQAHDYKEPVNGKFANMPSAQINQPSNQIKLTNVSLVRLKKGKKRFEIACYKNTVTSFRAGHETDLDNVLQIPNVFLNVSKGQVAPNDDLKKAFPNMSRDDVVLEILRKGEIQVGEKERGQELERVHREVVEIVAGRLVDPKSKRVYTAGMIEKALDQLSSQGGHAGRQAGKGKGDVADRSESREQGGNTEGSSAAKMIMDGEGESGETAIHKPKPKWTGVTTTKSAKSQALEAMKALIAHQPIPVARARMRLRITCPTSVLKQSVKAAPKSEGEEGEKSTVKDQILGLVEQVETQDVIGEEWEVVGFVEPGSFKVMSEFISAHTKGRARAEVLDMTVTHQED